MSLSRPLTPKVREELDDDPFMHKCCISDNQCRGRIEWHHHLRWQGKRSDRPEHIMPLCEYHHSKVDTREIRERVDYVWLHRLNDPELERISKAIDYKKRRAFLVSKYGKYKN